MHEASSPTSFLRKMQHKTRSDNLSSFRSVFKESKIKLIGPNEIDSPKLGSKSSKTIVKLPNISSPSKPRFPHKREEWSTPYQTSKKPLELSSLTKKFSSHRLNPPPSSLQNLFSSPNNFEESPESSNKLLSTPSVKSERKLDKSRDNKATGHSQFIIKSSTKSIGSIVRPVVSNPNKLNQTSRLSKFAFSRR